MQTTQNMKNTTVDKPIVIFANALLSLFFGVIPSSTKDIAIRTRDNSKPLNGVIINSSIMF